jgi:hypothetical protein
MLGRSIAFGLVLAASACGGSSLREGDAAVWISPDGTTWSRVESTSLGGPGDQQMTAVTTFGDGLVAVGFQRLDGVADGRVWLSDDGEDWRVVDDPALAGDGATFLWKVAETPVGLIAVGVSSGPADEDAAVWLSDDGVSWTRVTDPDLGGSGDQGAGSIAVLDDLILIGGWSQENTAVWTSWDGVDWSPPIALPQTGFPSVINDFETVGGQILAVGSHGTDAGAWVSSDGVTWVRIEGPALGGDGSQFVRSITVGPRGLLAVGNEEIYERIFFLGRGAESRVKAAVWSSTDGSVWERVVDSTGLDSVGDHLMYRVIEWDRRLVAVGTGNPDPRQGMSGFDSGYDFDGAVWVSDDGLSWARVRSPALGGEDWQDIFDVVAFGDILVAVGGDDRGSPPQD